MTYQNEPWFALLQTACQNRQRVKVAEMLGVSAPTLSQVLNGSGKYGTGEAKTDRFGERVVHIFGRYECPHLTEQNGEPTVIEAAQCSINAHRPPPVGSPRDMQFWQTCNACKHKAASAPVTAREVKPRGPRKGHDDTTTATTTADITAVATAESATPPESNHEPV